jgi:hypothetical protein
MASFAGSCLCGAVTYKVEGEATGFYLCHCSRCRKFTGTAHASNLFVEVGSLAWLTGKDQVKHFAIEGTRFAKNFCVTCASPLPYLADGRYVTLPAGSLDSQSPLRPMAHIFCESRAAWDDGFRSIPERARFES